MRLRFAGFVAVAAAVWMSVCTFSACNANEPFPDAGNVNTTGTSTSSSSSSSGSTTTDSGGTDATDDASEGGDAGIPNSCQNTIKDNLETDVDCGGTQCARCIDGKACIMDNDCQGGSCVSKKCVTATCMDQIANGNETDTDCGGTTCAKCQYGKKCSKNEDCLSNTCSGSVCRCPSGMAEVPLAAGGTYCVDATEVTKSAYNKFLTAGWKVADQSAECSGNTTFTPRGAWPPASTPPAGLGGTVGFQFNISLPVHYVDWCDAYTYCKWANKQLCGRVNGGTIDPGAKNDASQDAWYNACSQQGTKAYPYGDTYQTTKCNGVPASADAGAACGPSPNHSTYGCPPNEDDGVFAVIRATDINGAFTEYENAQCLGGSTGLFQMSGNVAEWEDSCTGTTTDATCNIRGGSYAANDDTTALRCDAARTEVRLPTDNTLLKDVGFRCCLY